jgi:hypothetical protein
LEGVLVLLRFHQELAESKMAQFIVGIVAGHFAELSDAFLQLRTHEMFLNSPDAA